VRSRIAPTQSLFPVATPAARSGRVRLDLLGGGEDGGRRVLGRLDDGVELAGRPPHAFAVVLGAPERRDLALGRRDRAFHRVELGLEPVQLRNLAPVGLDHFPGAALRRLEAAPQILDGAEDFPDPAVAARRDEDAAVR
jgi:hypothetical protein